MKSVQASIALVVAALAVVAAGPRAAQRPGLAPAQVGGTLRAGITDFEFTSGFDPTGEYTYQAWALYTNLLLRTLVTYKHVAGPEGTTLVPDLATEVPEPTDGGLTYTFHLKPGVIFGPPLNRPITSHDLEYAFARIKCRYCVAAYGFYYWDTIEGMRPLTTRPRPGTIDGIETPDDSTIVFHLTEPTGDFLHRLALPATAPIPKEVARCAPSSGDYGRLVISSGPYMVEGSEMLDLSDGCDGLEPISGYKPGRRISFVRNPGYDPATDSPEVRENLVDRVRVQRVTDVHELFTRVERGELDAALMDPPPDIQRSFESDPDLSALLRVNAGGRTWYLTMNLTRAPFDDLHVRRAVNFTINKTALRRAWGGAIEGEVATHVFPPTMTGGHPTGDEYDPYATPGHRGDEAEARAEMALSRYDSDGDGVCDAPACDRVVLINRNKAPHTAMEPYVRRAFAAIGINVDVKRHEAATAYTLIGEVPRNIPVAMNPGWGQDYPDPFTFAQYLFHSEKIVCNGNVNYALVGATPEIKRRCGAAGHFRNVPNVDEAIESCQSLVVGDERTACWVALDTTLMEEVLPWVPYLWQNTIRVIGPAVTKYEYDQFTNEMAFAHMQVDPSKQK